MLTTELDESQNHSLVISTSSAHEDGVTQQSLSSAGPTIRPLLQEFHSSQATFVHNVNSPHASSFRRSRRLSGNGDMIRWALQNEPGSPLRDVEGERTSESLSQHRATLVHDWQSWNYERNRRRFYRETKAFSVGEEERVTFDRIVKLAQRRCKTLYAAMTLVGPTKVEFIANSGPSMEVYNSHESICSYLVSEHAVEYLLVPDTTEDPRFANSALVVSHPFIRFYAGVPLVVHGYKVGTLTIADTTPRPDLDKEDTQAVLVDLAGILSTILVEQRNKAMSFDNDFAKISVGLFSHLQQPLQSVNDACNQFKQELLSMCAEQDSSHADDESSNSRLGNNNDEDVRGTKSTSGEAAPSRMSVLEERALQIYKNVEFLALSVENFLQLSLSLFQRLQENEAADLLPIQEIPALLFRLVETLPIKVAPGHKIILSPVELCQFQDDDDETMDELTGNHLTSADKSLSSIGSHFTKDWLAGVNVSMLWTLLLSVLCNHLVHDIKLLIHYSSRSPHRKRVDDPSRSAFLTMEFDVVPDWTPSSIPLKLSTGSPREDFGKSEQEALHRALEYLVHSMSGDMTISYIEREMETNGVTAEVRYVQTIRVELPIHVLPPLNILVANDPSVPTQQQLLTSSNSQSHLLTAGIHAGSASTNVLPVPHSHEWLNSNTDDITGTETSDSDRHVIRNPHAYECDSADYKMLRFPPATSAYLLASRPRISCASGMTRNNSRDSTSSSFFVPPLGTRMSTMSMPSADKHVMLASHSGSSTGVGVYPSLRLSLPPAEEDFDTEAMTKSQQIRNAPKYGNSNSFITALLNCLKLTGGGHYKQKNKIGQIVECDDASVSQTGLIFADKGAHIRRQPHGNGGAQQQHACISDDSTYDETQQSMPTTPTTVARWLRRMSASTVASQPINSPSSNGTTNNLIVVHRPTDKNVNPMNGHIRTSSSYNGNASEHRKQGFRNWLWMSVFTGRNSTSTKQQSSNKIVPLLNSQHDMASMELIAQ